MTERQRVILYGDSLLLVGIGRSLADFPFLEVICEHGSPAASLVEFCARSVTPQRTEAVIFDLEEFPSAMVVSLIEKQPDVLIIGLDSAGERLLLLAGQKAHTLTANRLVQLIDHLLHASGAGMAVTASAATGRRPSSPNHSEAETHPEEKLT